MTHVLDLINNKLVYTKSNKEYEHFISVRDQSGGISSHGTFYKLVKVKKSFVELSCGYFENKPEKLCYIITGQWGESNAIILNEWDWGNRCVWELGMEKIRPVRYIEDHIRDIDMCIAEVLDGLTYLN